MPHLSSALATFSAKFVNELDKTKSSVASPLSCEVLLALLTLGSSDPSHSELLAALDVPDDAAIRSSFAKLLPNLKSVQGVTLNMANKIYFKEGDYKLNCDVLDAAIDVFDASIEKINFRDATAAINTINKWVAAKTSNQITDLFKHGDVDDSAHLVLVNALYFKGTWKYKFKPEETKDLPFHVTKKKKIKVAMMHQKEEFRYGASKGLGAQLLEMPYVGERVSMLVVLPNQVEGLNSVLDKLAAGYGLIEDLDKMRTITVDVTIPKFNIETEIDLNTLLPKLGIRSIFDANNSGLNRILANREMLFVSKAVQKAIIRVNEEGTEAAAATGAALMGRSARSSQSFVADKPFLYVLYGTERLTLFIGAYRGNE